MFKKSVMRFTWTALALIASAAVTMWWPTGAQVSLPTTTSVHVLSPSAILEPSANTPSDKDGYPPGTGSADPEEGTLVVHVAVASAISNPLLTVTDSNGPDGIDDLRVNEIAATPAGVTRDLDYLDGVIDGSLTPGAYTVYLNLDKTGYDLNLPSSSGGQSIQGDVDTFTATLSGTNLGSIEALATVRMEGSAATSQNDLRWLETAPSLVMATMGETFTVRTKYSHQSAGALYDMVLQSYYQGRALRLEHVDLYYYDKNGTAIASVANGVPAGWNAKYHDITRLVDCNDANMAATCASYPYLAQPGTLSSGDLWVGEFTFTVIGGGGSRFIPYFQTKPSRTANWKIDTGYAGFQVEPPGQINPAILTITKQFATPMVVSGPEPPQVGRTTVYNLRLLVENIGLDDSINTLVTDAIPTGVTFVGNFSASQGTATYDATTRTVNWTVGTLEMDSDGPNGPLAGGSATLDFQVSVTPTAGQLNTSIRLNDGANTSGSSRSSLTPVAAGPSNALSTTPVETPVHALSVTKAVDKTTSVPGGTLTYTLTYSNTGNQTESDIVVTDTLPDRTTFLSASDGGSYQPAARTVTWTRPTMGPGLTFVLTVTVKLDVIFPEGSTTVTNTASITSAAVPAPVTAAITTTVVSNRPVAVNDSATTPSGTTVRILVLANDSDADGDPLAITAVTQPANGSATINADGTVTYTPKPFFHATDTFTYTISDGHGGTATATVTVTVTNRPPDAVDDATTTASGTAVVIGVLGNDTDPEHDPLTVTVATNGANGTVQINPDGTATYKPTSDTFRGTDQFTYTISDGFGGSDTATVTVTVTNRPPDAVNDAATTLSGSPVTVPVLANDTDPEHDVLTVTATTNGANGAVTINANGTVTYTPAAGYRGTDTFTYTISDGHAGVDTATVTVTITNQLPDAVNDATTTLSGSPVNVPVLANDTDPEHDVLTVTAVTNGTNGAVAINPDGTVRYTPNPDFHGTDTFTYTISDGQGGTATATVTVSVTNRPPTAVDDAATTPSGAPVTVAVLGNDSDPEHQPLTVTAVANGTHGTVALQSGAVVYTPNPDFHGTDTFTYTISDGQGGTATATVTVTVTNRPPTAGDDAATTPSGAPVTVAVLGNDSDPEHQLLTVTAVTNGTNGAVAINPDGTVSYTPNPGFHGTDTFTYTISDGQGGTATATVTVTVVNRAPDAIDDAATTPAGTPVAVPVLGNDADPEQDPLKATAVGAASNGTVTINGDWTVTYTPNAGFHGTDSFTYTISDGFDGTDTATVTITVVQPVLNLLKTADALVAAPGDVVTYTISYSNTGNVAATNVKIADALPAHTSLVATTGNGTLAGGIVTWTIPSVAIGASGSVTLTVKLDAVFPNGATAVSNTAVISSTETPEPKSSNVTTTSVNASPALTLEKTMSGTTRATIAISNVASVQGPNALAITSAAAVANDSKLATITYRLTVQNTGTAEATNVQISDVLGTDVDFDSATLGGAFTAATRTVTWTFASLAPGTTQTVDLTVTVK